MKNARWLAIGALLPLAFAPPARGDEDPLLERRTKRGSLAAEGGSKETEAAVAKALDWLVRHQAEDGHWDSDAFEERCGQERCSGPDHGMKSGVGPGRGARDYDVGVTGLALLALLGHGETGAAVARGAAYLVKVQGKEGAVGFEPAVGETIYNHAIAAQALCEAYALTRDPALEAPAKKAIDFCLAAQNPGLGWKYGVKPGSSDTSVTGWMVLALAAADRAGIGMKVEAKDGALAWLERVTDETLGRTSYERLGGGASFFPPEVYPDKRTFREVPALTAAAVWCRLLLGQKAGHKLVVKGIDVLAKEPPAYSLDRERSPTDFDYWFFGTYALFHATSADSARWKKWNRALQTALLKNQRKGGCVDGSFDPVDAWGIAGGRVYATAINALSLEAYYRFPRK